MITFRSSILRRMATVAAAAFVLCSCGTQPASEESGTRPIVIGVLALESFLRVHCHAGPGHGRDPPGSWASS